MDNSAVSPFMTFDTINETSDYTTIWWRIAKMKVNLVSSIVFCKDLLSLLFNIVGDTTPLRPVPNQEYDRCLRWIIHEVGEAGKRAKFTLSTPKLDITEKKTIESSHR